MRGRKFETWTDAVEDRGRQPGLAQGLAQGLGHARAKLRAILTRLLESQHGGLPIDVEARSGQPSIDELDTWIDRALDGNGIDVLFGVPAVPRQAPPRPPAFRAT